MRDCRAVRARAGSVRENCGATRHYLSAGARPGKEGQGLARMAGTKDMKAGDMKAGGGSRLATAGGVAAGKRQKERRAAPDIREIPRFAPGSLLHAC